MIITISGAACTGKTTLLNAMKEQDYKHTRYYGEFIRFVFSKDYSHIYQDFEDLLQGDPFDIINIHKETARMFNKILWSATTDSNDIFIFDRSPIDIGIYLYLNLYDKLMKDKNLLKYYMEAADYIRKCSLDFCNHNPVIFYTRPFKEEIEEDGFRPASLSAKRALEVSLFDKEFLSIAGVHVMPTDLTDRVSMLKLTMLSKIYGY